MQAIQEVAMAEECVKEAWNEAKVEADLRVEANKKLGAAE